MRNNPVSKLLNPFWVGVFSLIIYGLIITNPTINILLDFPIEHFYIVTATSIISGLFAIVIGISGIRLRNLQVIFVSMAFISLTVLFSLHGLSTPGVLLPFNPIVGVSVQLSFLFLTFWLWFSSLPTSMSIFAFLSKRINFIIPVWTGGLLIFSVIVFNNPNILNFIPLNNAPIKNYVTVISLIFAFVASFRYWNSFKYSRLPFQRGIAQVAILGGVAQIIASTGEVWRLGWWGYHLILLLTMIMVVNSLVKHFSLNNTLKGVLAGLFSNDPIERLEAGISPQVKALIAASEARDPYTSGHSIRVALNSVRFGIKLKLAPSQLRALAQGGVLHDIGKLNVPESILNKPGRLSEKEKIEIEKHPIFGHNICSGLGFMDEELAIIRSHHEKLNGKGYPDGLSGNSIPYLAKILSIADVYDALTSDRIYRTAMSKQEALKEMNIESGISFDPTLLSVWSTILPDESVQNK